MQFGHIDDITGIDFSLPPDHPFTAEALPGKPSTSPLQLTIGVPRWHIPTWKKVIYPKGTKTYLPHYARWLNGIEFNTTHYRIPSAEMIAQWRQQAAQVSHGFLFCPKVPQAISHRRQWQARGSAASRFFDVIAGFENNLGHCFMQLPQYASTQRSDDLLIFLEQYPNELPLGVEFRHASWFSEQESLDSVLREMQRHQIITVISDTPGRRDALHMALTAPAVMIRFNGSSTVSIDHTRLSSWVARLAKWQRQGLQRAYFFFHQQKDGDLIPTINYFVRSANSQLNTQLPELPTAETTQQLG